MTAQRLWGKYFVKRAIESNILIDCRSLHKNHIGLYAANMQCLTCRPFLYPFPQFFHNPAPVLFQFPPIPRLTKSSLCLFYSLSFSVLSLSSQNFLIYLTFPPSFCLPFPVRGSGSRCLLAPRGTDLPLFVCTAGGWGAGSPSKPSMSSRDSGFVCVEPATQNACKSSSHLCQGLPGLYS